MEYLMRRSPEKGDGCWGEGKNWEPILSGSTKKVLHVARRKEVQHMYFCGYETGEKSRIGRGEY